jgi:hypothetical protein
MEELKAQLRHALADDSHLEQQMKDQQRISMQKQKELDDAHREAIDSKKQLSGCIEVFGYLHKTLLGTPCFTLYIPYNLLRLYLYDFRYAAQFGQQEPDTGLEVRTATDTVKKELDGLFDAGRGGASL